MYIHVFLSVILNSYMFQISLTCYQNSFMNLHFQLWDQLVPSSFEEGGLGLLLNLFLLLDQELHKHTEKYI